MLFRGVTSILGVVVILLFMVCQIQSRSFTIDHKNNCFLKDGKYFQYASGSLHYYRLPSEYWEDRIAKLKYAGFNALETYVEWRVHEETPGQYTFEGDYDLVKFLKLVSDAGLLVILRPGPYIDAERDFGGLPAWLIADPSITLRSRDPAFLGAVSRWFDKLFPIVTPYLYGNGGPIIMVQVENEYGSSPIIDEKYKTYLRDLVYGYVKDSAVLFTTDGNSAGLLKNGAIEGVHSTIDFGSGTDVAYSMKVLRDQQPTGPLVNSEYYSGWLDHWGYPHSMRSTEAFVKTFEDMLKLNVSVNVYLFFGGTSFGFDAGANYIPEYAACPTSYDYDALLTEAGDPTPKYTATRELLSKYFPVPSGPAPGPSPKAAYGKIVMQDKLPLLPNLKTISTGEVKEKYPLSFEHIGVNGGFVVYETTITGIYPSPSLLKVPGLRDRGYVYINDVYQGIISRAHSFYEVPVVAVKGSTLRVVVENQGRNCYGDLKDNKGIIQNVTLHGEMLTTWKMTKFPLSSIETVEKLFNSLRNVTTYSCDTYSSNNMNFFRGSFVVPNNQPPKDTFLRMDKWMKGVVWINGHNIGRYWPNEGPQVTLYVPKMYLLPPPSKNIIIVFEQERDPCGVAKCYVEFVDIPDVNGITPPRQSSHFEGDGLDGLWSEKLMSHLATNQIDVIPHDQLNVTSHQVESQ